MNEALIRAGSLVMYYENGFLRYIHRRNVEIIRLFYFALRDQHWGTFPSYRSEELMDIREDHFKIHYCCSHKIDGKDIFFWNVTIQGNHDDSIVFEIEGKTLRNFKKNRAGFCVLHPIRNMGGRPVWLDHADGSKSQSTFPEYVDPQNPFLNLKAMRWQAADDLEYQLDFEGDIFETEDQRNWTDASFKTFCTPLALPFPVRMKKGEIIWQKIVLKALSKIEPSEKEAIFEIPSLKKIAPKHTIHLPEIGIGASTEAAMLSPKAISLLKKLPLTHYRVEVKPLYKPWKANFLQEIHHATQLNVPLKIALHLSENFEPEILEFIHVIDLYKVKIKEILLLSENQPLTSQQVIDYVISSPNLFPGVKLGAGTDANFTELNRNRFDPHHLDFISYAIHPQEHAFDNQSLIESLEGQQDTVLSARKLYPLQEIHISPLTLRKRFNPYCTDPSARIMKNSQKADPRQKTAFGAEWAINSLHNLKTAGVTSVTLFQTIGNQGLISNKEAMYPIYTTLLKYSEE